MKAPIPGQSLTEEPGAPQYERPPRYAKPEDALEEYIEKFDDPETRDALFQMLEAGEPLSSIVTVLTREAVRAGIHSFDSAVILRPMVHEYLTALADAAGVAYEEDVVDKPKRESLAKNEKKAIAVRVQRQLKNVIPEPEPEEEQTNPLASPDESLPEAQTMQEEALPTSPTGVMQRPQQGMM